MVERYAARFRDGEWRDELAATEGRGEERSLCLLAGLKARPLHMPGNNAAPCSSLLRVGERPQVLRTQDKPELQGTDWRSMLRHYTGKRNSSGRQSRLKAKLMMTWITSTTERDFMPQNTRDGAGPTASK